jgi:hypothetical protein
MRNYSSFGAVVWVFALSLFLAGGTVPAASKSLFESIFGFQESKPEPSAPVRLRDGAFEDRAPIRKNPFSEPERRISTPSRSGKYKTVCVRLCDGYYFPISHSSDRRQFYDDAQQCQARCGNSESRLFFMSPQASISGARDQTGLAYEKLKTAFLYRKKLLKNCACRPEPWSVSERMRHKSYEISIVAQAREAERTDDDAVTPTKPQVVAEGKIEPVDEPAKEIVVPMAVPVPRAVGAGQEIQVPAPSEIVRKPMKARARPARPYPVYSQRNREAGRSRVAPAAQRKLRWPGDSG